MSDSTTLTHLNVGDQIWSTAQMDNLPVGTVICERTRRQGRFRKMPTGDWEGIDDYAGRGTYSPSQFSMGGYNIVSQLPEGYAPPPPPPPPTLTQYMWKFRCNALSGAVENGVSIEATRKGLRLLAIPDEWEIGPGVVLHTHDQYTPIPNGTVVCNQSITDPDSEHYSLFMRAGSNRWHTLLGRAAHGRDLVVVQAPGVTETPAWWAAVGTEESRQEVAEFKARAWRIGQKIKSEQSWCGVYENVVARVGVNRDCLTAVKYQGLGIGDRVTPNAVAALPDNTLFLFRGSDDETRWAVYVRDDAATNLTRTRRLAGHRGNSERPLGNYATGMTIAALPDLTGTSQGWAIPEGSDEILTLMPPGTLMEYGGTRYMKAHDGRFHAYRAGMGVPATGTYEPRVFNSYTVTITSFQEDA